MPPGTGDVALSMAQYVPRAEVYVVTTPQAAAQRVAQRTAAMATKVNLALRGVIENMSWFTGDDGKRYEIFGAGGGVELAERLGVPLLGQVPLVPRSAKAATSACRSPSSDPDGEAATAFTELAERDRGARPQAHLQSRAHHQLARGLKLLAAACRGPNRGARPRDEARSGRSCR